MGVRPDAQCRIVSLQEGSEGCRWVAAHSSLVTADRHDLHEVVDALPEDQVARVLTDVRPRVPATSGERPGRRRSSAWESTRTGVGTCPRALTRSLPGDSERPARYLVRHRDADRGAVSTDALYRRCVDRWSHHRSWPRSSPREPLEPSLSIAIPGGQRFVPRDRAASGGDPTGVSAGRTPISDETGLGRGAVRANRRIACT